MKIPLHLTPETIIGLLSSMEGLRENAAITMIEDPDLYFALDRLYCDFREEAYAALPMKELRKMDKL